jgi:hypothetical protein
MDSETVVTLTQTSFVRLRRGRQQFLPAAWHDSSEVTHRLDEYVAIMQFLAKL